MEIINRQKEYELIADHDNNPVVMMGFAGQDASDLHEGHIHMASEIKRLKPTVKIIGKLFSELGSVYDAAQYVHAIYDPTTKEKIQYEGHLSNTLIDPPVDLQSLYSWIETNTQIDYVTKLGIDWFTPWLGESDKVGTAIMLPSYNLDFDNLSKPWEEIVIDADKIMIEDGLGIYPHITQNNLVRCHLIAALSGAFDYRIKAASLKDTYWTLAKEYIYKTYGGYEDYLVINPFMDTKLGVPMSGSTKDKYTQIDSDKIKADAEDFYDGKIEPTFTISPKWMNGKKLIQLTYELPDGKLMPIVKIE